MKQILQNMRNGDSSILEAPMPMLEDDALLISTSVTLISAGTERMLLDFGKASYLGKARQQPEKVRMMIDKIKTEGVLSTLEAVRSKLDQPILLGYSNVGVVIAVGKNVRRFKPGDRVVSNGGHADLVKVPEQLCARIPNNVDDDSAVFTLLASIALQGIRLAQPTLGESFVVIGAGLIGLIAVQLLRAHGCRVLAIDFDEDKLSLAKQYGADICPLKAGEDPVFKGMTFSRGHGVDGVLITASTDSNLPVQQAAQMSRKRGRIVLVGVSGLSLNRSDFYAKELSFQVSCSYGPGRYEPRYEEEGLDYPIGFVRWTEQRNFEAVLDNMASGRLDLKPLMTARYPFESAKQAYDRLTQDKSVLGILLDYRSPIEERTITEVALLPEKTFDQEKPIIGMIGGGNYASRVLIPAFRAAKGQLHTLMTSGGVSSALHGKRMGFQKASTDISGLLTNDEVNTLVIVTRHNSHAELAIQALEAGKHVFVEKPLALTLESLSAVEAAYHTAHLAGHKSHLMVGFNRRFSPQVQKIKQLLKPIQTPKSFIMTVNAGAIPAEHWTQDSAVGGGRVLGEACHFIDLMRFLADARITTTQAYCMGQHPSIQIREDKATITLGFEDGSFGTIHYLANGNAAFPKERIEIFAEGKILQLDNFRRLKGYGFKGFSRMNLWKQDKGQRHCVKAFLSAIEEGASTPISPEEIFEIARVTIEVADKLSQQ
ncbi:MAG: Gfo/Idh/MocA family oxidoreductase [Legionella sp.]|nr:Gfo/Idh/MocA family oxidoreductase [Legionella sp.]